MACEIVVATAADQTPQWNPPMNRMSSTMLIAEDSIR